MGKKARRFYQYTYQDTDEPVYVEDAGSLLKISGILLQGMGTNILVLTPQADSDVMGTGVKNPHPSTPYSALVATVQPPPDEWSEIIRRTDDPLVFEKDETGMTKAVHRKVRMAISGAVQQKIWVRDNCRCLFCGRRMGEVSITVDHWIPLELGGENNETNYVTACRKCNKRKGNIHPSDYCHNQLGWNAQHYDLLRKYVESNGKSTNTPDYLADKAQFCATFPKTNP